MRNLTCALGLLGIVMTSDPTAAGLSPNAIDNAFSRLYNLDFAGAHATLDAEMRSHPENPLIYAVRGAAYLFSEFDRLKVLESEFFTDDDRVTDRKRLKPDPALRVELFKVTAEARKRALAQLAVDPNDSNAMFALCTAAGVETDYVGLVEHRYLRAFSLSKESQQYARKLLAINPPFYDAYLTLGAVEYVVGNLNFFFRLFIRFDQIEGSKKKAIENLRNVVEGGRYFPSFAKTLLSAIYLRENAPERALVLLKELEREFPGNPLFGREIARAEQRISRGQRGGKKEL